ncbi:MAG TPA: right-handed parallel beta-helix repeat-containing protein [Lacipirellula sp.]
MTINSSSIHDNGVGVHVEGTSTLVMNDGSVNDNDTNGLLVLGDGTLQSITVDGTTFSGNAANGPTSAGQGDITLFEFASATPSVASFTDVTVTSSNPDYAIQIHGGAGEFTSGPLDSSILANVSFDNVDILGTQNRMAMLIQQYADLSTFSFNDVTFNSAADGGLVIFDAAGSLDLGNTTFHDTYDAGDGAGNGTGFDIATSLNDVDATDVVFLDASNNPLDKNDLQANFAIEDRVGHAVDAEAPFPAVAGFVDWVASGAYADAVFLTVESFAPAVGTTSPSVERAIEVADAEPGKDHVYIQQGNYVQNSQILIDNDVDVTGDTAGKPVITPGQNFTGNNAADAWILVDEGVTFGLDSVVLDGDGFFVWQALRLHGNATVDNVDFRDIQGSASGSPYRGVAIQSFGGVVAGGAGADSHGGLGLSPSHLVVTNSTFQDIGRIGVLVKGTGATADITGNTYTGKGAGDWLDYGIEAGGGAVVDIEDNTITGNLGVASDGSTSAGVLVTTFWGAGTEAHLSGANDISSNTVGVHIGFDAADSSVVTIAGGSLIGNTDAAIHAGGSGVELTVSGADLKGNHVGIFVENDAQVDAGGGSLGNTGGNILTGYTGVGGNYAIENRNEDASGNVDVYAEGNAFGSTIPAVIEQVVFHTVDDPQYTQVFFGNPIAPPNTPFPPTVVFVDDNWAGSAVGSDADGAGGTLGNGQAFGYDQFASIQDAIDAVAAGGTVYVYGGMYAETILIDKTLDLLSELAGVDARGRSAANEAIITPAVANETAALVTIAAADVTVDGFTIDGDAGLAGGVTLADGITVSNAARGIAIDGDNAQVLNNRVQNFYRRGIQSWVTAAAAPVGGVVSQNEINNIGVATPDGFFSGDGILAFSPLVEVTDNDINDATTGITFIQIYPTVATSIEISGNTIDATNGIALNEISANTTMTVSGNTVTTGDGGVGLLLWTIDGSVSVDDSLGANAFSGTGVDDVGVYGWDGTANNAMNVTITGGSISGYETGVHLTNEEGTFGPSLNIAALTLSGVDISTAAGGIGVLVEDTVAGSFAVEVNIQDDSDITTGGGTAVLVSGASASANIIGNDASIHGNAVGVDVNGGSADVTGNHIFDNSVGVQFRNGGAGSVTGNNFDGATDNGADVLIQASAGSVTIGDGNDFAGDNYFIDNQSTQSFDLSGHAATTYEGLSPSTLADAFRIEDKMFHGPDNGISGVIRVVAGELFVTTNGTGDNDETIQNAIDVANPDDTINIEQGNYAENLSISKDVNIIGVGNVTLGPAAAGNVITIDGAMFGDDETVSIANIDFNGSAGLAGYGIRVNDTADFANLLIDDSSFTSFGFNAIAVFGDATSGISAQNVEISDSTFVDNGIAGGGGSGDLQFFLYNGDATLTNLDLSNTGAGNGAHLGIQFRGVGAQNGAGVLPMGAITFTDIDISGLYVRQMIGLQRYDDAPIDLNDVRLGGAGSAITGTFGAALRIDAVGDQSFASPTPSTIDLGDTYFRGVGGLGLDIEIAPDGFGFLRADATNTRWDTTAGTGQTPNNLSLADQFEVEDRILHFVDGLHPMHGAFDGFVETVDGNAYITVAQAGSIQRGVDVVDLNGTVNVNDGAYAENVMVHRSATIDGQGLATILDAGGGNGFTVQADDVTIRDLRVTSNGAGNGILLGATTANTDLLNLQVDNAAIGVNVSGVLTDLTLAGVTLTGNVTGLRASTASSVVGLDVLNSHFDGNQYGATIYASNSFTDNETRFTDVLIQNTSFSNNLEKGLYVEKLNNATLDNVTVHNSGTGGAATFDSGIDVNLKYGNYTNIDILGGSVNNSGTGDAVNGSGLTIKARDDAPSYAANPATLTDVLVSGMTFDGNSTAIRIGEPGKNNAGPTAVVFDSVTVENSASEGIEIVGGSVLVQQSMLDSNSTGIRVAGVGRVSVRNSTSISGGGIGVDVDGGTALVENADLNGNTIGVLVQNGGVADLGQSGIGNFTGLGESAGGNDFTGYTVAATAASGAIVNLNAGGGYSAAGPQGYAGAEKDVAAFNNLWNDGSTAGIENVIWHDADDTNVGFIDYASLTNLIVSLEPLPTVVTNEDVSEGSSTTVYGQFTNDAQAHEVTINWGDGSPDTTVVLPAGTSTFAIASPATAYTDDPNGPVQTILRSITVTVEEVATPTNSLTDTSLSVDVSNVIPDAPLSTPDGDLNEGETFTIDVGPAVDPGNDTISAYRINWGDGTNDVYVGNLSTVSTHTHTYQDGLASPNVTVTLDIFDDDGTWNAVESLNILVHNIDPTADGGFFAFDAAVDEGSTTTVFFVGPFTDPGNPDGPFHFAYDFNGNGVFGEAGELGDGTYAGSSTSSSAVVPAQFLADDDDSPRTVRARIIDNDGGFTEYSVDIGINNVSPEVDAGADSIAFAGVPFMHTINFTDPGADAPWTVNVDWNGDGDFLDADESAFGVGGHSFTISHTYSVAEIGNVYNVAVQVDDGDGGVDSDVFQVTVVEDTFRVTDFVTYASGIDITFNHAADLDVLNLYSGQGGPITPPDVTVVGSSVGAVKGSIVWNPSTNTLSFVKTGGVLAADTYTVTLVSGDDAFQNTLGSDLDGDGDFTPGGNYTNAFAVASSGERVVSIQDFARGAGQEVNLPIDTSPDFHVRIDNAAGVTAVDVDIVYDPALLNVTGAAAAAGLPAGWSLTSNFASPGLLKLTLSGTTPLVGSNLNLIRLEADVPTAAPYGASQVVRLQELRVNEDAIASKADFSVHKAVYVGDADGDGQYLGFDASLISRVVVNLDSGFAAHDWTDPLIVADASGDGTLSGQDASLVAQEAALIDTPEIPPLPGIVLMPAVGGLDPTLSVSSQFAAPGDTVTVPVVIEVLAGEASDPTVVSATFDVFFNDSALALTVGDIAQGGFWSVADDWSLTKNVVGGQARLVFFNSGGEQSLPGSGDIAYLSFTLDAGMTPGQVVNLDIEPASATEGGLTWTNSDGAIGVTYTADFDLDGDVDGDDLSNWQSGFGTEPTAAIADGDENRDGDVDGRDFLAWQRQLGSSVPPLATASAAAQFADSSVMTVAMPSAASVIAGLESPDSMRSPLQQEASWWINEPAVTFNDASPREVVRDRDAAFDDWSLDDDRSGDVETILAVANETAASAENLEDSSEDAFDPFDELFSDELDSVLKG